MRSAGGLGGLAHPVGCAVAAAAKAAAFPLGHATPNAELLAIFKGVLEAILPDDAASADLLGFTGRPAPLREEEVGIHPQAVC